MFEGCREKTWQEMGKEHKKQANALPMKNLTSQVNNSRILQRRSAKYEEYCFYMDQHIQGSFYVCVCVTL